MSSFDALLLIGEVTVVLYLFWRILDWTFDAIEQWHEATRQAAAEASREDAQATEGTGS